MAKRTKKAAVKVSIDLIFNCLAILLAVVSIFLIFAPAINVKGTIVDSTYSGANAVFGYTSNDYVYFNFSFLNLLPYLFVIAAVVLLVLRMTKVIKAKFVDYIVIALLIAGGVLFFLTNVMAGYSQTYANYISTWSLTKSLLAGPIVAGILSLLSGVSVLVAKFIKR